MGANTVRKGGLALSRRVGCKTTNLAARCMTGKMLTSGSSCSRSSFGIGGIGSFLNSVSSSPVPGRSRSGSVPMAVPERRGSRTVPAILQRSRLERSKPLSLSKPTEAQPHATSHNKLQPSPASPNQRSDFETYRLFHHNLYISITCKQNNFRCPPMLYAVRWTIFIKS